MLVAGADAVASVHVLKQLMSEQHDRRSTIADPEIWRRQLIDLCAIDDLVDAAPFLFADPDAAPKNRRAGFAIQ